MNLDGYRDLYIQSRCLLFPIFAELDVRHMNLQECNGRHQKQNMNLRCSSRQVPGRKDHVGSLLLAWRIGLLLSAILIRLKNASVQNLCIDRCFAFLHLSPFSHSSISLASLLEYSTPSSPCCYILLFHQSRSSTTEFKLSSKCNSSVALKFSSKV